MHKTTFTTPCGCVVTRGEALRAFVAAIYDTAKVSALFTTDDVFERVQPFTVTMTSEYDHVNAQVQRDPGKALRAATASSKLIAVALRIAAKLEYCEPVTALVWTGGKECHSRPKRVWTSNITAL